MQSMRIAGFAFAAMLLAACAAKAGPLPSLYTAAQASAGANVFTQNCTVCHGIGMTGGAGPALIGQAFAAPGIGATIGGVFSLLTQQMPASNPGSLSQTQYEDVMAYILQQNGYPAGGTGLVYKDSLASTVPLVSQVK